MSEAILVHCPQCSVKLKFKTSANVAHDKKVTCPKCEAPFVISKEFLSTALATATPPNPSPVGPDVPKPAETGLKEPGLKPLPGEAGTAVKQNGSSPAVKPSIPKSEIAKASAISPVLAPKLETTKSPQLKTKDQRNGDSVKPAPVVADLAKKALREPAPKSAAKKMKAKEFSKDYDDDQWDDMESSVDDWVSVPEELDPYDKPRKAPPGRSGSRQKNAVRSQDSTEGGLSKLRELGVLGWLLFGLPAGLAGAALTVAVGYTGNPWLISLMALVVGILTGVGVRFGAGQDFGLGPGFVAGTIAVLCVFGGKVGAFYVSQELPMTEQDVAEHAAGFEQRAAEATTDPVMISAIAETVHDEWRTAGKITDQKIEAHFNAIEANRPPEDPSKNYLPEVWQEASKTWATFTPTQKAAKTREIQQEWYGEDGLDPALNPVSEPEAISYFADELQESWIESGRITDEQVDAVYTQNETPEDYSEGYLPEVWQEATNRWNSQSEEQKKAARDKDIEELKRAEVIGNAIVSNLGTLAAVLKALLNCFWPFTGPLCFGTGVSVAYRLGNHGLGGK